MTFRLDQDDRLAFLGQNGNGKTTLAKLIAEKLEPMTGVIQKTPKLSVAYFSQIQTEELDINKTAYDIMSRSMKNASEVKVRAHLGRFGLTENKANTRVEQLSGGEKSRLLLALITKDAPNILILDEPTNHLDIASREALIMALNDYQGAVILITHDLHIIELTCDRLWHISNGTCKEFSGSIEDFKTLVITSEKATTTKEYKKEGKQAYQEQVKLRQEAQNKARKAEKILVEIENLEQKLEQIKNNMEINYTSELQQSFDELTTELHSKEEEYFSIQE